jgi:3-hydroxyisobutyrate dehydrogenase-like beta-hydroxyacid dehydrogenase
MPYQTAFIGLGVMGYPMAGFLAKNGHQVAVYNRTKAKAEAWLKDKGGGSSHRVADTPRAAAKGSDFVFTCVGADKDLREIAHGEDGILAGLKPGAVWVDNTTASASVALELAAAVAEAGGHFLDAPVSGGQSGAENGALTVMVGGEQAAFDRAEPVIQCFAKSVKLIGGHGAGQMTKMVNQMCIAGTVQGLAEGLNFAMQAGLDPSKVVEVISKGAAQSWQMDNRAGTMIQGKYDYGFAVDWMRKDLGICLQEARRVGVSLPLTALVDQFYADVQAMGGKRWDTSSLLARLRKPK